MFKNKSNFLKISLKKAILILLIFVVFLGMAVFGVSKFFQNRQQDNVILQVGSLKIPTKAFLAEYNVVLQQNLQYIMQNPYYTANILQGMISRYTSTLLLANEASSMYIGVSDDLISQVLSSTPYFQNEKGEFDKNKFAGLVSKIYGSEDNYINFLKTNVKQTQLAGSIVNTLYVPKKVEDYYLVALNQSRNIDYVEFSRSKVNIKEKPSDKDLEEILKENASDYVVPEYRSFSVFEVNLMDYLKNIKLSDKDIQDYYNKHKDSFTAPETRDIKQVLFKTEKEAEDAYKSLKDSSDIDAKKYKVTTLRNVSKDSLPDAELANKIFSSEPKKILEPIKTSLGYHLVLVVAVHPKSALPIKKVENKIKTEAISEKLSNTYEELKANITKAASSTSDLNDLHKKFNSKLLNVSSIDKYGFDKNHKALTGETSEVANNQDVLTVVFATPVGKISDLITSDNKFYIVKVNKVDPSYTQNLQQAKASLIKRWKDKKVTEAVQNQAKNFIASYSKNHSFKGLNVKPKNITISRYTSKNIPFNKNDLDQIFLSEVKTPIEGYLDNGSVYVAITNKIFINKNKIPDTDQAKIKQYVNTSVKESIVAQLFDKISTKYKVVTNDKVLKKLLDSLK